MASADDRRDLRVICDTLGPFGARLDGNGAVERQIAAGPPRQAKYHFGGFSSFHGSLTIGIVSISTLASFPSTFSARRI